MKKTSAGDDLFPETTEREITRTNNNPPEALPQPLANVADLPAMMKADLDKLTAEALAELGVYARVPDTIVDKAIYERATTLGTRIKAAMDAVEKRRTEVKAPYLAATTLIDKAFKLTVPATDDKPERTLMTELKTAHTGIKSRLSAYDTAEYLAEEKRRTDERNLLATAAAKDGIEMGAAPVEERKVEVVKSEHGGSAVRNIVTDWTVVDEALLPRSVLSIDPAKVKALIDGGATTIPGIALEKKVETHVKKR